MKKLLTLVLAAATMVTVGCAEQRGTTEEPTPAAAAVGESEQSLSIDEETDVSLKGTFVHGESFVTFSVRLETPMLKTHMVINGAEVDFSHDLVKGVLDIDGHENTILTQDAAVLAKLEKAFEGLGNPNKLRAATFSTLALMAAAPRGTTLTRRQITPGGTSDEENRGYCDNNDGITYLCGCNSIPSGCSATFMGWGGPEGNNPLYRAGGTVASSGTRDASSYVGGYVSGCSSTPAYTHEHEVCEYSRDSSYHGRVTWTARCGWSASACEGRCGAGCPNSYNFYITKDCHDHDVCLNNHPGASAVSTFGDCGNEFDRASGDFASGTGAEFASLCGSWMYGETTR